IVAKFRQLLESNAVAEADCQVFLEKHSQLIYKPFMLHHGLHCLITKFRLGNLITDFAYLTACSDYWYFVLIELEHPRKKLFRKNSKRVIESATLTEAKAQIASWQDYIGKNKDRVIQSIYPLLRPLEENRVFFKYVLVMGRGLEKSVRQDFRNRLATLSNGDFKVCTYDTLINSFVNEKNVPDWVPKLPENVLQLIGNRIEIKSLLNIKYCKWLLNSLKPDELFLKPQQKKTLLRHGYDITAWEQGKLFKWNWSFQKQ
ncbi:MAG: Shedu anti-phage system protein SduA domain-containing protein, partial [Limisphaerales bacterium]